MSNGKERAVLVVRLPDKSGEEPKELRDYILESLRLGVLVVGQGVTYKLESLPELGGVILGCDPGDGEKHLVLGPVDGLDLIASTEEKKLPATAERKAEAELAERKAILERLRRYRKAGGLGCFNVLSEKSGVDCDTLRELNNGTMPPDLKILRKVARGLDKLQFEAAEAGNADG